MKFALSIGTDFILNRGMKLPDRFQVPFVLVWLSVLSATQLPAASATNRAAVKDLNTPRAFPAIRTLDEWQGRAKEIREQILVSCGLWPLPEKTPLRAHVFGKIDRDGYSVEKVYFQTYPGFYLASNLYRPLGKGRGPFPGVLNPHGHWANGRMADTKDGSIAARCISFARQGMVAFSYDMVGYNDTHFPDSTTNRAPYDSHRQFGADRTDQLWSISLMGLQTWNSIRALDFLVSLRDVDKSRLACTGESGGGTQTFMLGAVDDRLAVQAPIVMVSHTMQGGCSCENVPGLRIEHSNMEIAAAAAPRPQILVAATGDWTKATMEVEGPAIENIYRLFGARDKLRYVRFDFGHNYNQTSREAVYEFFGQRLLKQSDASSLKEQPYHKEPDADLRVFPDGNLPADALPADRFADSLRQAHQQQWQALQPRDKAGLDQFKQLVQPAWQHTLQLNWPMSHAETRVSGLRQIAIGTASELTINRWGGEAAMTATCFLPRNSSPSTLSKLVLFADGAGPERYLDNSGVPGGLIGKLIERGHGVIVIKSFATSEATNQFANFYTTYNRTKLQERVRDLVTACSVVQTIGLGKPSRLRVILCGSGRAGLWALLAAPAAAAVIADCDELDVSNDEALLEPDLFCPGIRNIGTFEGGPMLAAPHPLLLHNTGEKFSTGGIKSAYKALSANRKLRIESGRVSDDALVAWVSKL